jgi:hypothetical protein
VRRTVLWPTRSTRFPKAANARTNPRPPRSPCAQTQGVWTNRHVIQKVTEAMFEVEGEAMRDKDAPGHRLWRRTGRTNRRPDE